LWPEKPTSDRNWFVDEHANRPTIFGQIRLLGDSRICVRCLVIFALLALVRSAVCAPFAANAGTIDGSGPMATHCEVELDIFSGMPNPTWPLSDPEADSFVQQVTALPHTVARELAGNLGYRGFIVQCTQGAATQVIRIQSGTVHLVEGATTTYARDEARRLERWLLDTGKPHLRPEIFQIADRELG